jgi:hypothetical protein
MQQGGMHPTVVHHSFRYSSFFYLWIDAFLGLNVDFFLLFPDRTVALLI